MGAGPGGPRSPRGLALVSALLPCSQHRGTGPFPCHGHLHVLTPRQLHSLPASSCSMGEELLEHGRIFWNWLLSSTSLTGLSESQDRWHGRAGPAAPRPGTLLPCHRRPAKPGASGGDPPLPRSSTQPPGSRLQAFPLACCEGADPPATLWTGCGLGPARHALKTPAPRRPRAAVLATLLPTQTASSACSRVTLRRESVLDPMQPQWPGWTPPAPRPRAPGRCARQSPSGIFSVWKSDKCRGIRRRMDVRS